MQNITFEDGYDGTHQATCTANIPTCWYGGVDGGGSIYVEGGQFPGGQLALYRQRLLRLRSRPRRRRDPRSRPVQEPPRLHHRRHVPRRHCSNGGALSSISVQWSVLNSRFSDNDAIGKGANPASPGTPGGGSGGAIYLDGTDDNLLIAGTVMDNNSAREGGGAVFDVVDTGWGALTFKDSHLHHDISGAFQTFPGVYYDIDGRDSVPTMVDSTDR